MSRNTNTQQATYKPFRIINLFIIATLTVCWLGWEAWTIRSGFSVPVKMYYTLCGLFILIQFTLALLNSRRTYPSQSDNYHVSIIVPVYNENHHSLMTGIQSFFEQSRLPDEIHVVEDGSIEDYSHIRLFLLTESKKYNIKASWTRQGNLGKRMAHKTALRHIEERANSIIVTVDSDAILDSLAIEQGLRCFADDEVMSVAGLVIATNAQHNTLSRITDLLYVGLQQLIDRSAMSQLNHVLVNSGGLAFYRKRVIDLALDNGYTSETFFNHAVGFSDDSYFTLFAMLLGKTVKQEKSIVFTDMPINLSHHIRQQLRWARGSFIRGWWRIKYLPIDSWGFIRQFIGWILMLTNTCIIIEIFIIRPILYGQYPTLKLLLIPFIIGYLEGTRYFSVRRSDMSFKSQLLTYVLSPLAVIWSFTVLRFIRFYGMFTCYKTGWGTRKKIEL